MSKITKWHLFWLKFQEFIPSFPIRIIILLILAFVIFSAVRIGFKLVTYDNLPVEPPGWEPGYGRK